MSNNKRFKRFAISLGGSVAFPETIDPLFFKKFYSCVKNEVKKGNKFVIVVGGGFICRAYQAAAAKISKISNEDKDWLGIYVTHLNARFLMTVFKKEVHPALFDARHKIRAFGKYSVIIGAGWKPGCSTDFDALQIAIDFHIPQLINLGKQDYVYTSNPDKDKLAKPIKAMTWQDYFKIIPERWRPGLNVPFDPIAANLAKAHNIKVIMAGGRDLENFRRILRGEKFKGTILANNPLS